MHQTLYIRKRHLFVNIKGLIITLIVVTVYSFCILLVEQCTPDRQNTTALPLLAHHNTGNEARKNCNPTAIRIEAADLFITMPVTQILSAYIESFETFKHNPGKYILCQTDFASGEAIMTDYYLKLL